MSRAILSPLVCLLVIAALADTASAGPFRRIWERRKEELRGELDASLSAKVESDVARESKAVESKLTQANHAQIVQEAQKLSQQVSAEVSELRKQALADLAAETKKIQGEMRQQLAEEIKRMQEQTKSEFAKLRAEHTKQLETALAEVKAENKAIVEQLTKTVESELAKVPQAIETASLAEGEKVKAQVIAELRAFKESDDGAAALRSPAEQQPAQESPEKPPQDATLTTPPKLEARNDQDEE